MRVYGYCTERDKKRDGRVTRRENSSTLLTPAGKEGKAGSMVKLNAASGVRLGGFLTAFGRGLAALSREKRQRIALPYLSYRKGIR